MPGIQLIPMIRLLFQSLSTQELLLTADVRQQKLLWQQILISTRLFLQAAAEILFRALSQL